MCSTMLADPDPITIQHARAGDSRAFSRLVEAYQTPVYNLCYRVLGNPHDAEEAAQDELRTAISGIALPDEAELKKLARYRRMLEDSLQRRLAALDQLRRLTAGKADVEKAKEYRVKLRVVA